MNNLIRSVFLLLKSIPPESWEKALKGLEKMGFTLVPEAREAYKMNSERAYMLIIALCGGFMTLDVETQALIGINTVLGLVCAIAGGGAVGRIISQKSIAGENAEGEPKE